MSDEIIRLGGKVAYISSDMQSDDKHWYKKIVQEYQIVNPKIQVDYFDLFEPDLISKKEKIKQYGALHLSGGSTYKFIEKIRETNFKEIIVEHEKKGGLVIGVCAGGIVLTPTINIVEVGERFVKDKKRIQNYIIENDFNDYSGLNLVSFEFYPHFYDEPKEIQDLQNYVNRTKTTLYACKVEDGIFVEAGKVEIIGKVRKFSFK